MDVLVCCVATCPAKVIVRSPVQIGFSAAVCANGHPCWVVRAAGKTVVMNRREGSSATALRPSP